tara:strand:+ start:907 stop:1596 length:690 start_codon:yes stop_codon:yes gene_type:complete
MARTYGTATLKVTIKESITLNSKDEGQTHSFALSGISSVFRRVVGTSTSVDTDIINISSVASVGSAGSFLGNKVKYLRITNLDDTNYAVLTITNGVNHEAAFKLEAGQSFIISSDTSTGLNEIMSSSSQELTFTDNTVDTNSNTTMTLDANSKVIPGLKVSGSGIATGTKINSVNTHGAPTSVTLDTDATATASNITAAFSPGLSNISKISAKSDTATCDLELFLAESS